MSVQNMRNSEMFAVEPQTDVIATQQQLQQQQQQRPAAGKFLIV